MTIDGKFRLERVKTSFKNVYIGRPGNQNRRKNKASSHVCCEMLGRLHEVSTV